MTLRIKFLALLVVLMGIALITVGSNFYSQQVVTSRFEEMTNYTAPAWIALGEANTAASRIREEAVGVALLIEEEAEEAELAEDQEEIETAYAALQASIIGYGEYSQVDEREQLVEQLLAERQHTYQASQNLIAAAEAGSPDKEEYKEALEDAEDSFLTVVGIAIQKENDYFADQYQWVQDANRVTQIVNWVALVLGIALLLLASGVVIRQIILPIEEVKEAAIKLGQGDLSQQVAVTSQDEIGVLGQQFNVMAANIQQQVMENRQMAQSAMESNAFKSSLIARVSHELRSPLGAILGVAEMLVDGEMTGPLSEQQQALTSRIINNSHDLTKMVNELLEQSRLDASRLELKEDVFDPRKTIQHVLDTQRILARSKTIALTCEIDDALPEMLWGDANRLEQIVANLVYNAIKFTDNGSVDVKVTLPGEDRWTITVQDTGIGIPADAQGYIFEAFRQVDESATRKHNGLGLGLSIVQQIVQAMNGTVTLKSEVGQGSTFTVTLPMEQVERVGTYEQQVVGISG